MTHNKRAKVRDNATENELADGNDAPRRCPPPCVTVGFGFVH
jgi:hypothetical protein